MKCPNCQIMPAIKDSLLGYLPCKVCQHKTLQHPGDIPEMAGESIKAQRKQFADDIEQPHRSGSLNKRWLELHGKDRALKMGFTEKEIKEAKYVYNGDSNAYYSRGDK